MSLRDSEHEGLDPEKRPSDNVVLGGEHWTLMEAKVSKTLWGVTHHDEKLIEISENAEGKIELDTIIHECLHAPFPWLREWAVQQTATEIANILWELGYRKV